MNTFVDNFSPGDLIYGLDEFRRRYLSYVKPRGFHTTIDMFNNDVLPGNKKFKSKEKVLKHEVTGPDVERGSTFNARKEAKEYHDALCQSKFSYKGVFDKDESTYIANYGRTAQAPHRDKAIRRACKFGIEHSFPWLNKVHFVLDGIKMEDVTLKKQVDGLVPFTSSELRYIYRNKNALREKVIFYKDQKVARAPWDSDDADSGSSKKWRTLWEDYGQQRISRGRANLV